ncbi:MAG: DNA integrity scanning protein DisA nucleotide-binding domain protein, partial [Desulfovibrio sp.]|nr:DNA integrity scanning protein DisA nucleotide-binding domain protein [Desulfovibrio sp.]
TVPEGPEVRFLPRAHLEQLQMAGVIAYGGRSHAVPYQVWFTEEHPTMCCTGPTRRWLEYAVRLFSQNYETQNVLNIDTAGYVLQQCAIHAIRDYIVDERAAMGKWDTQLRVYPILDAVIGISRTQEEGLPAEGDIVFVEPSEIYQLNFLALFPDLDRPHLENFKRVRKLLQSVEGSRRKLVSDGRNIVGISIGEVPDSSLIARYHGSHGFLLLNGLPVCSFSGGNFSSSNRRANLVELEELVYDSRLNLSEQHSLMNIVTALVDHSTEMRHGCTLVLDLADAPERMSGQYLVHPLDLRQLRFLELAKAFSKIDGALHISSDLRLQGFGCLLDGHSVPGENMARGARYNSALRYTAEHEQTIVVVVSSDRPVSIIQGGVELTAACVLKTMRGCPSPPRLEEWLQG